MENRAILEGLLFVVGEDGLNIEQIKDVFQIDEEEAKNLIFDLKNSYNNPDRGLRIDFLGNKIKLYRIARNLFRIQCSSGFCKQIGC